MAVAIPQNQQQHQQQYGHEHQRQCPASAVAPALLTGPALAPEPASTLASGTSSAHGAGTPGACRPADGSGVGPTELCGAQGQGGQGRIQGMAHAGPEGVWGPEHCTFPLPRLPGPPSLWERRSCTTPLATHTTRQCPSARPRARRGEGWCARTPSLQQGAPDATWRPGGALAGSIRECPCTFMLHVHGVRGSQNGPRGRSW